MNAQGLTILAVDDHADNLTTLQAVVGEALPGARVLPALDGRRGLELARDHDPDVILLDIVMPGLDGFETCRLIKGDPALAHIPVIFLTALRTDRASRLKALEAGAEGFLTKPLDETELIAQIRAMAKIKAAHQAEQRESQRLAELVAARTAELERELNQRRQAEEALRQSHERYYAVLENAPVAIYETNDQGDCLFVNAQWRQHAGLTQYEALGQGWRRGLHPEDRERITQLWYQHAQGKAPWSSEYRFLSPLGRITWVHGTAVALRDSRGRVTGYIGTNQDITERKRAEEALRQGEERLRHIFEQAAVGMSLLSPEGLWLKVNQRLCDILGYPHDELMRLNYRDVTHPEDLERDVGRVADIVAGKSAGNSWEKRYLRKDGQTIWVRITTSLTREPDGAPQYFITVTEDITQRKRAEEALRQSEEKYRGIFESIQDIYYETSLDGTILELSPSVERLSQYTRQELIGRPVSEIYAVPQERVDLLARIMAQGGINDHEIAFKDKDGRAVPCSLSCLLSRDQQGRPYKISGVLRDITERKKAGEALRASEIKLRAIFDNSRDAIGVSKAGRHAWVNPAYAQLFGYASQEDMTGVPVLDLVAPACRADIQDKMRRREAGLAVPDSYLTMGLKKDGTQFDMEVKVSAYELQGERHTLAILRDITERKRAEEALRHSEERLRHIFEQAAVGMSLLSPQGVWLQVNQRLCDILGYTREELTQMSFRQITHPDDLGKDEERLRQGLANAFKGLSFEKRYLHKDGHVIWARITATVVRDAQGRPRYFVAVTEDISERKQAEEALRQSQETLRLVSDHIYDWEYWIAPDLKILFVSPSCQAISGYSPAEFIANPGLLEEIVHPEDQDLWRHHLKFFRAGEGFKREGEGVEFRILAKDGQTVWISHRCRPVFASDGAFLGRRVSNRDISQRKQDEATRASLEAQLRQAHKMEALGTLAGGIAHDFNNILAAVLGFAEMARDDARAGRVNPADLDQIMVSAQRARELVQKILAFSRKQEPDLRPMNLNKVVGATQEILQRTLPKMIAVEAGLSQGLPPVMADPTQIEQVLLNLASNAQDAMAEGGRLLLETQTVHLDHDYCRRYLEVRPGLYARLMVSDTGQGMDSITREHIFEPFFTTKEVGKGTGLGLSSVYGIVKNHGGHIHCYSEPGQGTVFNIYLPALQAETVRPETQPAEADEAALCGSETILLVDDEQALRMFGQRMLSDKGYRVLTAGSGEEALEVYREKGPQVDLVLMDLGMPGMGGHKALKEILALDPRAKVVIASGYTAGGQAKDSLSAGALGFVPKPFRRQELLDTVRKVLDGV